MIVKRINELQLTLSLPSFPDFLVGRRMGVPVDLALPTDELKSP